LSAGCHDTELLSQRQAEYQHRVPNVCIAVQLLPYLNIMYLLSTFRSRKFTFFFSTQLTGSWQMLTLHPMGGT